MTLQINSEEAIAIAQAAALGIGILMVLLGGLFFYLLVRPPRRKRGAPPPAETIDAEEVRALIDRMESRLETLERVIGSSERRALTAADEDRLLEAGQGSETRRMQ